MKTPGNFCKVQTACNITVIAPSHTSSEYIGLVIVPAAVMGFLLAEACALLQVCNRRQAEVTSSKSHLDSVYNCDGRGTTYAVSAYVAIPFTIVM